MGQLGALAAEVAKKKKEAQPDDGGVMAGIAAATGTSKVYKLGEGTSSEGAKAPVAGATDQTASRAAADEARRQAQAQAGINRATARTRRAQAAGKGN